MPLMNWSRRGGLLLAALTLAACTTIVRAPSVALRVNAMPPARVEIVPPPPQPELYWVPGHWMWRGAWVWNAGHYQAMRVAPMPALRVEAPPPPPSRAHIWIGGHWHWAGGWQWASGRWVLE